MVVLIADSLDTPPLRQNHLLVSALDSSIRSSLGLTFNYLLGISTKIASSWSRTLKRRVQFFTGYTFVVAGY